MIYIRKFLFIILILFCYKIGTSQDLFYGNYVDSNAVIKLRNTFCKNFNEFTIDTLTPDQKLFLCFKILFSSKNDCYNQAELFSLNYFKNRNLSMSFIDSLLIHKVFEQILLSNCLNGDFSNYNSTQFINQVQQTSITDAESEEMIGFITEKFAKSISLNNYNTLIVDFITISQFEKNLKLFNALSTKYGSKKKITFLINSKSTNIKNEFLSKKVIFYEKDARIFDFDLIFKKGSKYMKVIDIWFHQ